MKQVLAVAAVSAAFLTPVAQAEDLLTGDTRLACEAVMLIDQPGTVGIIKVNPTFRPSENSYPHYRLLPMHTEAGKYWCLLFYISEERYLLLEPRLKRDKAVLKLSSGYLLTAPYPIFEIINK